MQDKSIERHNMRFCYAFRRFSDYPYIGNAFNMDPERITVKFLKRVNDMGFDGIELGMECLEKIDGGEKGAKEFAKKLNDNGVPLVAIRSGGLMIDPKSGQENYERIIRSFKFAEIFNSEVINGAISIPPKSPYLDTGSGLISSQLVAHNGLPFSQNSSRETTMPEYEMLAEKYISVSELASDYGLNISCEVHQNSPVDNSWSAKLIHKLVNKKNFGINPDLGNIVWNYDIPEESTEDAILELAPISNYWHCKNLTRVNHPENNRTVFLRETIMGGEIDYRFAVEAMFNSNYDGFMSIEGVFTGDQYYSDKMSLEYCKNLWKELEK